MQNDGVADQFVATFWVDYVDFPVIVATSWIIVVTSWIIIATFPVIVATNQFPPRLSWIYPLEMTIIHSSSDGATVERTKNPGRRCAAINVTDWIIGPKDAERREKQWCPNLVYQMKNDRNEEWLVENIKNFYLFHAIVSTFWIIVSTLHAIVSTSLFIVLTFLVIVLTIQLSPNFFKAIKVILKRMWTIGAILRNIWWYATIYKELLPKKFSFITPAFHSPELKNSIFKSKTGR